MVQQELPFTAARVMRTRWKRGGKKVSTVGPAKPSHEAYPVIRSRSLVVAHNYCLRVAQSAQVLVLVREVFVLGL
jgi:hypothetical protein